MTHEPDDLMAAVRGILADVRKLGEDHQQINMLVGYANATGNAKAAKGLQSILLVLTDEIGGHRQQLLELGEALQEQSEQEDDAT